MLSLLNNPELLIPQLLMDILRFGPEVEVLAPIALRELVALTLSAAANRYRGTGVKSAHRGKT